MNRISTVGDRVTSSQFLGTGTVQGVRVLKYMANVVWPNGLRTWTPLEDLQDASSGSSSRVSGPTMSSTAPMTGSP